MNKRPPPKKKYSSLSQLKQLYSSVGSALEEQFVQQLKAYKITGWQREYRFHATRRWRFDFAFVALKLAVEIEGGTQSRKSRHTSPEGFHNDCDKYNAAGFAGWTVLRFTAEHVRSGEAIDQVRAIFREG